MADSFWITLFLELINSKLFTFLSGIFGGVVASLSSVYVGERMRERKENKRQRIKIFKKLRSIGKRIIDEQVWRTKTGVAGRGTREILVRAENLASAGQADSNFVQEQLRKAEETQEKLEKSEKKLTELEAEFYETIGAYYAYFGFDEEIEKVEEDYRDVDRPDQEEYENKLDDADSINEVKQLLADYNRKLGEETREKYEQVFSALYEKARGQVVKN